MSIDDQYWAEQIRDIIETVILNIKKLETKIEKLEIECEDLIEECKELEAVKWDINLIREIVTREVGDEQPRMPEGGV